MIAADTTVVVAAAAPWHDDHATARSAVERLKPRLLGHVAVETYSVLTRLPPPLRLAAAVARDYLIEGFESPPLVLSANGYRKLIKEAADVGIVGGALYDALVGATARESGASLLTLDRRAVATYQLLGVDYRLIV